MTDRANRFTALAIAAITLTGLAWFAGGAGSATERTGQDADADHLAIVWTSGDPHVAHRMTLMYANGANRQDWFDEVQLIIWGPSQQLVVGDKDIRATIMDLQEAGVQVQACQACADSYGITDALRSHGLEVKYMGQPLSNRLKSDDWHVLTF